MFLIAEQTIEGAPFAASFNLDLVACFDLKGLFCYRRIGMMNRNRDNPDCWPTCFNVAR